MNLVYTCLTNSIKPQKIIGAGLLHRSHNLILIALDIFPHANAEAWGLAKIIRPAEVCKALVTTTRTSAPT